MHQKPLAERLRPKNLSEFVGQSHLIGPGKPLRNMIDHGTLPSIVLWGPPGVGKTTLAFILCQSLDRKIHHLSAVTAGVKDIRAIVQSSQSGGLFGGKAPVIFIDEIHRFNKSQQDSLLHAVEKGEIVLIGATTENPSFELNNALLSRCQVFTLEGLEADDLVNMLNRAVTTDSVLKSIPVELKETEALIAFGLGDARKTLNNLELLVHHHSGIGSLIVTNALVEEVCQQKVPAYDKNGENHYDIISAFIKSVRGSHVQASLYWLARMLKGGEAPVFIARRLLILASEDIGLANPTALVMANATFDAVHKLGMPEARIPLSQCTIYLATSPKSNSAYMAINKVMAEADNTLNLPVPLHLRNAPTQLMKNLGYGKDYKYPHDYPGNFVEQTYLPPEIEEKIWYEPGKNAKEVTMRNTSPKNLKNKM
ncbi:MAG: replication-associated recombination protein A [Cryomorphaceae bacterium]|nr:replication-associated recombination protein A [Cryomorphaceae bacterium]